MNISFIITCYNIPEELLKQCVSSITELKLKPADYEIIVVDDGSKQSPLAALQLIHPDIIYIRQTNQGLSAARNAGLNIAKGEYIQFIDGDDQLITHPYKQCLNILHNENADILMFRLTHRKPLRRPVKVLISTSGADYMVHHNLRASACGYIFRRELLGDLRFTPNQLHEDEAFTPQLLIKAKHLCDTDATPYLYNRRSDSITNKQDFKYKVDRLRHLEDICMLLKWKATAHQGAAAKALSRRSAQLTMDYLYKTITLLGSTHQLELAVERLQSKGLFPLPKQSYTRKYALFRLLSSTRIGRKLLLITLKRS